MDEPEAPWADVDRGRFVITVRTKQANAIQLLASQTIKLHL